MTREEILAMPKGRKLDALVAKYVMFPRHTHPIEEVQGWCHCYSSLISAAWEVVENLQRRGMFVNVETYRGSFAARVLRVPGPELGYSMEVDTAPEAICKAALLAVMEVSA